jgi:L-Ala-D/L-Glu epimerase
MNETIRVTSAEVGRTTLRKQDPKWKFALGARPLSEGLVLRLVSADGVEAFGYASDIPHLGFDIERVEREVAEAVIGLSRVSLLGHPAADVPLDRRRLSPPAFAALEMAILDLRARTIGVGVARLLGGVYATEFPVLRILAIKTPDEMAANAKKLTDAGYRHLKVKIDCNTLDDDVERIRAIRDAVGSDIGITLDANQSYDAADAVRLFDRVEDVGIDVFEQPVPIDDIDGLAEVSRRLAGRCTVEADESCNSLDRAWQLISTGSCTGISLKILRLGGLTNCLRVAQMCEVAGVRCRVGAHVGSRALNAAALHLAASIENIGYACELGEFDRLDGDPFTGLEVEDGKIRLSDGPGLGVTLREDAEVAWR